MKNIMIDLETMGHNSNSAIVSIAAIPFDINTGEIAPAFVMNIDLDSCLKAGLHVTAGTVWWWLAQSDKARQGIAENPSSLQSVLGLFKIFLEEHENASLWGNSARFDLGLLENAYNILGYETPWKFWNERCLRTLSSLSPEIKKSITFEGTEHNPVDDCLHQIKYCVAIMNKLNNK